ncbi:hypothetical protein RUND412_003526 [Rhizina undulata]
MPPRLSILSTPLAKSGAFTCSAATPARSLLFCLQSQTRGYAANPQNKPSSSKRKKPTRTAYTQYNLADADQFSLAEAMRYIKAFEVGQDPVKVKYELAVKLKTQKSGPTIKNRMRLPKPVKTDMRVCVIAEGPQAQAAKRAGAVLVGTTEVFEEIRNGNLNFDRCLAHESCFQMLAKAKLGKILGPKGLMPSPKNGTVVHDVAATMKELTGKSDYRERAGVIRMAVGQLGFTEKELQKNIKTFMDALKKDFGQMSNRADKSIAEVVLSSTNSAGFSLSGDIKSAYTTQTPETPQVNIA